LAGTSILFSDSKCDSALSSTVDIKFIRVVNETEGKIKKTDTKGGQYIAAINEFICTAIIWQIQF